MADAIIEIVGQDDLPTIAALRNQIFRPSRDVASFQRLLRGRYHVLQMMARMGDKPVAYFVGFEKTPETFFAWSYGVHPDHRRQGVATQLWDAIHEWAISHHYESVRLECPNAAKPMMHLALSLGYDIVGTRWDATRMDNLVVFEKDLAKEE
jgi:GNAT superfamily N-acetyltransferase